ncbi:MAG: hypothetical protein JJU30_03800 [Alkalimonas sp.]|nr:hypothetical protein [Alkalimonas sp.]
MSSTVLADEAEASLNRKTHPTTQQVVADVLHPANTTRQGDGNPLAAVAIQPV